jgi:aldose 1-epimerase
MGIPLLYPWANRLADFSYSVAGKPVALPHERAVIALDGNGLPIHGVIPGRLGWDLQDGGDGRSLAARLSWSESRPDLFEVFPFRHELLYEALLEDECLQVTVTVDACGEDPVPVAFGFHPYLSLPATGRERWLIELPAMRHLALDEHQIPVGHDGERGAQRFTLGVNEFDDGFDGLAPGAAFAVAGADLRIEVQFLEGYPCAQVYAPQASPFICFEPMTAPANALRSGTGLRLLAPGERSRARFCVRVGP